MRTIFKALNGVQSDLAALGIGKNQQNDFDKYKYRGIDDVLNALAPILAKHGVLIVPSVTEKEVRTVPTQKGGAMNFATLKVDYTLYDSEGDAITHSAYGEAMDRGDKSINKAMTAAYKYFVFQAFCVPLVGHDADSESHEMQDDVQPKPEPEYPTTQFAANLPKWRQAIKSGTKTPDDIIKMVETKGRLTAEQKNSIKGVAA